MPLASCTAAATSSCHVDRLRLFLAERREEKPARNEKQRRITVCAAELVIRFGQFFLVAQLRARASRACKYFGWFCVLVLERPLPFRSMSLDPQRR
jgi:hypothetical protein